MFKTKFFADASIIESAYILKASTENFAKVQYLKTRTEVMMDPITRQLKKMIVELLMLLAMTRMKNDQNEEL